ncbi:LemA family protein [Kitasatospora atroaurantiaca]|uniref:LemA protein n=1 Tax=Kitasatospora atroaurantiaca TaxID=285545 RepID=A0A561F160_9ACTN|nr:LemA family protein [Kitasatospora atroaurantiaca]TWE21607.1 LemA protein [Kitasatospora atroaurantiaca]
MGVIVGAGIAVLVLAAVWWTVRTFNRLIRLRNQTQASWAQIDVQLRRRHDLIPNLVEATQGYAAHERATLAEVTAARAAAITGGLGTADRARAENALSTSLTRLFALGETYPELKADGRFAVLQSELTTTENKIAYARQFFNSAVQSYNTALETFPANLVAGLGSHGPKEYFEADAAARDIVEVRF